MTNLIQVHIAERYNNVAGTDELVVTRSASRLQEEDATLWGSAARAEASERLGWIEAAGTVNKTIEQAQAIREQVTLLGYEQVLLCGMGGSSLSPQVMAHDAPIPLVAVDSVHPDAIDEVCSTESLLRSLIIVSSKSGGTVETRAQLALCETRLRSAGVDPADRIVVITDPGSQLEAHARERGYTTVLGNPLVGGRYSALTVFGIVPSVLAGAQLFGFDEHARAALTQLATDEPTNPAIQVAAALSQVFSQSGTLQVATHDQAFLPEWIEQLIAESTGKDGQGLLPIPRTHATLTATGGTTVCVASASHEHACKADITVHAPLAAQFYFWEVVTSLVCALRRINPFDQPDVEHTKKAAREMDAEAATADPLTELSPGMHLIRAFDDSVPSSLKEFAEEWLSVASASAYVAVQAFAPHRSELIAEIGQLTERITGVPCAVSYGPEYLHSTGQLHKGGQPGGIFLNILVDPRTDVEVPSSKTSFGWLLTSASLADQEVLSALGRSVTGLRIANEKVLEPFVQHLRSLSHAHEA